MEVVGNKDVTKPLLQPPNKDMMHYMRVYYPINSGELQYKPTNSLTVRAKVSGK